MAETFRIERSTLVEAPPETVYALVADFRRWQDWSPFEMIDPNLKRSFAGSEQGLGAIYEWSGNAQAGAGRMEIVETIQPSRIDIKLDFSKPFRAKNGTRFSFEREASGTRVTWTMKGSRTLSMKLAGLLFDFDKMIGNDFMKGLAKLKALAEAP